MLQDVSADVSPGVSSRRARRQPSPARHRGRPKGAVVTPKNLAQRPLSPAARWLLELRIAQGYTQKQMAQALCLKPESLSGIERGRVLPSRRVLRLAEQAFPTATSCRND